MAAAQACVLVPKCLVLAFSAIPMTLRFGVERLLPAIDRFTLMIGRTQAYTQNAK
jgi:hypothetical protein